jgi:hypothetical protein
MKMYGGVEVQFHPLLTLAAGESVVSFTPWSFYSGTLWIGKWVNLLPLLETELSFTL